MKYFVASDNPRHIYFSDLDSKNQLTKFSIKENGILWKTGVEGNIFSILESVYKNEVKILSISDLSFFITTIDAESGITISQVAFSKTEYNIITSIDKKESILLNADTSRNIYFGRSERILEKLKATETNNIDGRFQVIGNKIYLFQNDKIISFDLSNVAEKRSFQMINKSSDVTEINISDETLSFGLSGGDVFTLDRNLRLIWKVKTGGKIRYIKTIGIFTLVISDDNFIYLFTKKSGSLVWKFRNKNRILLVPFIEDEKIFVLDILESNLKILSLNTGTLINQLFFRTESKLDSLITFENQRLYLLLNDRILYFKSSKC